MCLEDLRLGKGRFPGPPKSTAVISIPTVLLPADPRRVAVILSFWGVTDGSILAGDQVPSQAIWMFDTLNPNQASIQMSAFSSPITLRIEDHGQLVMRQIAVQINDQTSLGIVATAQPINSDVNVDPIAHIPPVQGR